jgi:glycosyl-4,4'-diaponeurosporenoate acyltransferase
VELPLGPGPAVLVSSAAWAVIGVTSGWAVSRIPLRRLEHDTWLTRPRRFEDHGRVYERRLRIRRWKDRLPEAGGVFRGGTSKRHLGGASDAALERFAAETRRAELVHWINACAGPLFLIWCPWGLGLVMVAFGLAAHLPFVVIQRSNRARIERVLAARRDGVTPLR